MLKANDLMIVPKKLNSKEEYTLKRRIFVASFIFVYYFLLVFTSFMADDSLIQWATIILPSRGDRGIFALLFLFLIVPLAFFSVWEVNKLIFDRNKISFSLLFVATLAFALAPNFAYVMINYYFDLLIELGLNLNNDPSSSLTIDLFLLTCVGTGIFLTLVVNIVLKVFKQFNFKSGLTLNFLIWIISFSLMSFSFLGLVKSWVALIFIILVTSGTDTMAYIFGIFFGRHKMAPVISPNKTWEGAIMSFLTVFALSMLFAYFFTFVVDPTGSVTAFHVFVGIDTTYELQWVYLAIATALIIWFSMVGDLTFSFIKRTFGIKDFSKLLGEHGGFLDRFDSTFFTTSAFTVILFLVVGLSPSTLFG